MFVEFGTVELVSVPRNRETGQARGFAFVDMATREDLEKAVEGVNGIMFGGRTLRAAESLPKDQVKKQAKRDEGGTCVLCLLNQLPRIHNSMPQTLFRRWAEKDLRWQSSF